MTSVLRMTEPADGVAEITIDAPPLHLVDGAFIGALTGLLDTWDAADDASRPRVAVWRSADPDFFLMHGDVAALVRVPAGERPPPQAPNPAAAVLERLRCSPVVTIGVLDGAARGGGAEFLTALDLRYGTSRSVVGWPEVAMGILPGSGGTARLPRILGRAATLELLLTAGDLTGDQAHARGWLQAVVAPDDVLGHARDVARRIAAMPAPAIAAVKAVVDESLPPVAPALLAESRALSALMAAGEHTAPMRRFLEAGGQTRTGELNRWDALMEAMLRQT